MIRKNDKIKIKPEYQDHGDQLFTWIAADDEEKGRVTVMPIDTGFAIAPTYVLPVDWLELTA